MDINNDGKKDLVFWGLPALQSKVIYFYKNEQYNLTKSIINGFDVKTEFDYHSSLSMQYFGNCIRYVYYPLVTELRQSNGIGNNMNSITYNYGHANFDFQRRQFLGFEMFEYYENEFVHVHLFEYNETYHQIQLYHYVKGTESSGQKDMEYIIVYQEILNNPITYKNLGNNRFICYSGFTGSEDKLSTAAQRIGIVLDNNGRVQSKEIIQRRMNDSWDDPLTRQTQRFVYKNVQVANVGNLVKIDSIITTSEMAGSTPKPVHFTTFNYNNKGHIISKKEQNPDATVTTSFTYNNFGLPSSKTISATGLTSRTEQYGYDNTGRFMTQHTNPLNHISSWTYDGKTGNVLTATDINGLTTTHRYDNFGRQTSTTYPDATKDSIRYEWNPAQTFFPTAKYYIIRTFTAQPSVTTYYDKLSREITNNIDGVGFSDTRYDSKGQIIKTSLPYGSPSFSENNKIWHTYTYDMHGRLTAETAPYTNLSYSYNNLTTTTTDHLRNVSSSTTTDAAGRTVQSTDPGGTINYSYSYITQSNKIRQQTVINAVGAITTIKNDLNGNRLEIVDPDAGTITNVYNAFGEMISQTDANGNVFTYQYDKLGRVTGKNNLASSYQRNYAYDSYSSANRGRGKISSITENGTNNSETFIYDNKSRLISHQKTIEGSGPSYSESYAYNDKGQLYKLTYPNGFSIKYLYNSYGELSEIRRFSNDALIYRVYSRNSFRQTTKCEYGNEAVSQFTYNNCGLITQIKTGNKMSVFSGGGGGAILSV